MFTCCTESCVDMFRTASLNLLKAHIHIRHPGAKKIRFLCFCQICKGEAFKDNNALRDHLVQVHGFEKDSGNTLTHFFCIPCKKQIGNRVAWEAHRNKYYHTYRFGVYTANKEKKSQGYHDIEEGIGLDVEDFTVCTSIQEAGQASKNSAGPGPKSKQNLLHCVNCPDIFHRNRIEEHVYKCHPNSTFQCEYIVKKGWNEEYEGVSKRRCGKMLVTAPNMIKHLQYHDRSINRIYDACIKRLVTLPEDLRWFRCQICSLCVNAQNIAVISDHVKSTHSGHGGVQGHGEGKEQVDDEGDGILPWHTQPLLVVDFGCRICGVVAQGPQGYDKLMVHIQQCRDNHRISVFQRITL
ncbi:uncharacterized protein LOC111696569 isoform X2 [Eurytemora carolleeae]|uniref:uncharacterized protein LOC111696569 isoform X2 n=1 Tax=Eurytemora carolleeae TaxID=1294199 RepID=UPI000C7918E1|nr:uncharacterized protein LOC111696569 isoform X2 [Eurytemora carolleeae]|eukprot:XP_023321972.1 uncharacterized protein LOC111696569 isoform X2 [Eurytemora affinis]